VYNLRGFDLSRGSEYLGQSFMKDSTFRWGCKQLAMVWLWLLLTQGACMLYLTALDQLGQSFVKDSIFRWGCCKQLVWFGNCQCLPE
jgi:hypothetical protein